MTTATLSFRARRTLSVPDQHQLRIARRTMRYNCIGAAVMGGPNHFQAASIIHQLTGVFVNIDADCTCKR